MNVPEKYSNIFEKARMEGIRDEQTWRLIREYRKEFFCEPRSFVELLGVCE